MGFQFGIYVWILMVQIGLRGTDGSPTSHPGGTTSNGPSGQHLVCRDGCHISCRGSSASDPSSPRFCYCRCQPATVDYGSMVYSAVVDDIWQIRCGYLGHPFIATALAMNDTGLLDEFAVTRCHSDYVDECNGGRVCNEDWAQSLCMETCANGGHGGTTTRPSTSGHNLPGLCAPDEYFRSQRASYGNPYTGCTDLHSQCSALYDRGYCQLRPAAMNCQKTCGRCIGDDTYMPWNAVRSQLIQWAMNRRDDGTAKALINYYMTQFADYVTEVHRTCIGENEGVQSGENHEEKH